MEPIFDKIRSFDYGSYLLLHDAIHGRPWLNATYLFFAKYGIIFFFLAFIYLILRRKIIAFITSFIAMSVAATIDTVILLAWKRPRPFISHSSDVLPPITEGLRVSSVSFPSVHTYVAFAIASSIFLYGHKKLGLFLFLMALGVAIGRVGAGLHYPSDVIAGACLGIASGIAAYLIASQKEKEWD